MTFPGIAMDLFGTRLAKGVQCCLSLVGNVTVITRGTKYGTKPGIFLEAKNSRFVFTQGTST